MKKVIPALILFALAGCAGVQPWERDVLARPEMALDNAPLDAAIDEVDGATHLIMSKDMRRKLYKAARNGVGGDIRVEPDQFGFRTTMYNDLPILIADYNDRGERIIDFDEAGPNAGNSSTSIYVVRMGDGYVTGLQNGVMEVNDLGKLDDGVTYRTHVEWLVGLAVMHGRACARVWGITNADVTT